MLIVLLPLPFSCTVVTFPLSYRILHHVGGVEIEDNTTTTTNQR